MSEIDWSRPIEAVHEDGRVVVVALSTEYGKNPDRDGLYTTTPVLDDGSNLFHPDGANWHGSPWCIRNVAQPAPERDPMRERLEELARAIAEVPADSVVGRSGYACEARAIVAALPKQVDPDEQAAAEMCKEHGWDEDDEINWGPVFGLVLYAIRKGRALAAQDAARG